MKRTIDLQGNEQYRRLAKEAIDKGDYGIARMIINEHLESGDVSGLSFDYYALGVIHYNIKCEKEA